MTQETAPTNDPIDPRPRTAEPDSASLRWASGSVSRRRFIAGSAAAAAGAAALLAGCGGDKLDDAGSGTAAAAGATPTPPSLPSLDPANFERAAQYSFENSGVGVLVMRGHDIAFERYATEEQTHRLASGTKSFCGAIAAAAVQDGILSGFDEIVSDTITEWQHDARDPGKAGVTIRQMLSLTAGLEPATSLLQGPRSRENRYLAALDAELMMPPNTAFIYGSSSFFIFGELMRRKLESRNEGPLDYLMRRVLDPIGLRVGTWAKDDAGNPHMPNGAILAAREWAKFGLLIKQGGTWEGRQILDPALLAECFRGSAVNPGYGLTFWLGLPVTPKIVTSCSAPARDTAFPEDLVLAAGHGKQRLYIIPSLDLVVVQQAESSTFRDREFLSLLLGLNETATNARPAGGSE
ncbi:MAG: serine hydrolase [Chloroflexi bacterium]|nr:serine hydrolase [Chloroflexota bacterium]